MATAFIAAKRSKDPETQVGAVIVGKNNKIVGIGYNGMPRGCDDSKMPWGKCDENPLNNKGMYVVHAEMNAIANKNCESLDGFTMYSTLFPCNNCAQMIIQHGIKEVVYFEDRPMKEAMKASRSMLEMCNIKLRQWERSNKQLSIDFATGKCVLEEKVL
ncbi:Deoxycytidylate deaminase [Strongyloides ratti]|uniref:Probable deoxycytidylate deaminase n=1 Tax=Strongyloides ratti TaxID=34506 RepID=A0A090KY51_STRRB|nr:Deoxycytidylate deaminase [Strongyloides ratti]CEF60782.1 Deoxycytidylate deaminase [Strongyloides ratti]